MKPHPKKNTATYRPFLERLGGSPISKFVGEYGELFYDPANPTLDSLRISDGKTKGGVKLSQSLKQAVSELQAKFDLKVGDLTDRITEIYNMIDGSKLEQIQEVINSFLEVSIENFDDLKDRVLELEDTAVRRAGDVMTGGLKIKNQNNYKLELIPAATGRPAGSARFTYNDNTQAEIYWDPSDSHIDFAFPSNNRVAEADVMLELGKDALSVYTKTDIKGDLFVNDVDVLAEISKVKIELAAELLGLSIALKTKYNKEGGDIFGPVNVKPSGAAGMTLFSVDGDGPQGVLSPTRPYSLTNKKYVDETTIPFDMRKMSPLPN